MINIILAIITGLCISGMIFFNGSLSESIGNLPSLLFIHLTGFILTALLFIRKQPNKKREKKSNLYLLAGILGIVVVTISNLIFSKGGVLLTLSGTLAGQVLAAFVMESIRHKNDDTKIGVSKIISTVLVVLGASILGLKSHISVIWILLSWIPGILILIQSYMNSQNILSIGFRKTLIFHFGTVFIVLIPLVLLNPIGSSMIKVFSGEVPIPFLIGGGSLALFVVSIGSYLLLKLKPIIYVLLLYSGQLIGALVIDYIVGIPLSLDKLMSMGIIVIGLIVGEYEKFKKGMLRES